jgi:nucleotide-binding universal stress UspA family protein
MKKIEKILFPIDLSITSPQVVPWVKHMMGLFNAQVHVIFVARSFVQYSALRVPHASIDDFEGALLKGAEENMAEFMETHFKDTDAVSQVVEGYPGEEILGYAKDNAMDIIILATHGRRGLERVLFGSVAEYVVKNSAIPVMTINPYRKWD